MAISATNTPFFDYFPQLKYNVKKGQYPVYESATDIFFRIGMIEDTLRNTSSYGVYEIQDGDTPEIIASKFYDDVGGGWVILYANKIVDPQWDWPLNYQQFVNYIEGKYGSVANATSTIHHYEKVVTRTNVGENTTQEDRYVIDKEKLTYNTPGLPYNYYNPYEINIYTIDDAALTSDSSIITLTADNDIDYSWKTGALTDEDETRYIDFDGNVVIQSIRRDAISNYDYEERVNEAKRSIKLIHSRYYKKIINEFVDLTTKAKTDTVDQQGVSYIRRLL